MWKSALWILLISLSGCNVVPPLDCVLGVARPGCERDANGQYGYLYASPWTPPRAGDTITPIYFAPAYSPPPPIQFHPIQIQQPVRLQTTCQRSGDFTYCQ